MDLINKISKLNKGERELLTNQNYLLEQKRILKIKLEDGVNISYNQIRYCAQLSTGIQFQIKRFNYFDSFIFQLIIFEFS